MEARQTTIFDMLGGEGGTSGSPGAGTGEHRTAAGRKRRAEVFNDYEGFVEKFKPKITTDDCYTPPEIYDAVLEWVGDNIAPLDGLTVRRPFKPGGDYQGEAEGYGPGDVVIDNPPFSILAKIIDFYCAAGVMFFLFAPSLTLFSAPRPGVTYICVHAKVIYENGARVKTSFVTNMEGRHRVIVAGDLCKKLDAISDRMRRQKTAKEQKRWLYPMEVMTSALIGKVATRGICFKVPMDEAEVVRKLDNQCGALFGGGFLLSERAAAERAAAERAAAELAAAELAAAFRVELSEREREIVKRLGSPGGSRRQERRETT